MLQDDELSHHAERVRDVRDHFENLVIHGENRNALNALRARLGGKVQCVYIDPPYNTGSAFAHYDDALEEGKWLSFTRDRLLLLRELLAETGVIFVSIGDDQAAYLRVLMDEVFGRSNFCGHIVWEKKKKPSFLNTNMGIVTELILSYARCRERSPAFVAGTTTAGKKYPLNNAGNRLSTLTFPAGSVTFHCRDGRVEPQDMSDGRIVTRLSDPVEITAGTNRAAFRLEGEWRYSQPKLDEIIRAGEKIVISKVPFRPNHVRRGGEPKKMKNLVSMAHCGMSTYEDATDESRRLFGDAAAFDYPKPERLIAYLISAVTDEGDWVLDAFAGSGTTGAVAHKLRRRWVLIELGEHCRTHIVPRLRKVIDGSDGVGVSRESAWTGGGGFRFLTAVPAPGELDSSGRAVFGDECDGVRLVTSVCRTTGFRYEPDPSTYWRQGRSDAGDFIYVTTRDLDARDVERLSREVGQGRRLTVVCRSFPKNSTLVRNLTLRQLPVALLSECKRGRDTYTLEVSRLSREGACSAEGSQVCRRAASGAVEALPLFGKGARSVGR